MLKLNFISYVQEEIVGFFCFIFAFSLVETARNVHELINLYQEGNVYDAI